VHCERSLIVLKNYLGDTVMATPLVRSVYAASGSVDVFASRTCEQILRFPDIRLRFAEYVNLKNPMLLFRAARNLRHGKYDCAFIVNRSFRSALMCRLAGIKRRIGHATEGRAKLLTDPVPYDDIKPESACYLDLVKRAGIEPSSVVPELYVSDSERSTGRELLEGAQVGIQAGARHEYKQVPVDVWRELGSWLTDKGFKLAFFGGAEERPVLGELRLSGVDLVGKTSLRDALGAMANLQLMIGGDTGVMHLAAGVGTPTISAFGPTPSDKWGWHHPPHQVLVAPNKDITKLEAGSIIQAAEKVLCAGS